VADFCGGDALELALDEGVSLALRRRRLGRRPAARRLAPPTHAGADQPRLAFAIGGGGDGGRGGVRRRAAGRRRDDDDVYKVDVPTRPQASGLQSMPLYETATSAALGSSVTVRATRQVAMTPRVFAMKPRVV